MNPAVLFLAGGVGLAVVLSAVVWLFSRPKKVVEDPNRARTNLRALPHGSGPSRIGKRTSGMWRSTSGGRGSSDGVTGGIRVLGNVSPDGSDADGGSGSGGIAGSGQSGR